MKKFFIIITLLVAGCQTTGTVNNAYQNNNLPEGKNLPPQAFAHFTDIPVPDNAAMNLDKTVILGSGENWTGKLAFTTPFGTSTTFDFFVAEMPKLGWKETAIVRANVSFLTYNRSGRELIIQIYGDKKESYVDMMVSPERINKTK